MALSKIRKRSVSESFKCPLPKSSHLVLSHHPCRCHRAIFWPPSGAVLKDHSSRLTGRLKIISTFESPWRELGLSITGILFVEGGSDPRRKSIVIERSWSPHPIPAISCREAATPIRSLSDRAREFFRRVDRLGMSDAGCRRPRP